MFNRRKELEQRIQELEKMQKKGYYGNNENNEFLKEVYRYAYQLSLFSAFSPSAIHLPIFE